MRSSTIPRGARTLKTYLELRSYLEEFAGGGWPFVWIFGRPGVAKTESIRGAMRGREVLYLKGGQLTPAEFYIACYHHRGQPVILDDAEHILDERVGAKLVSALGDTSRPKQLNYGTTSRVLGNVPPSYFTTSPLCIIANRVTSDPAIQSRATMLHFVPTTAEIHGAVALWFWDQEIYDWIGQQLTCLRGIEMRHYLDADQDKRAGRDWRRHLLGACATKSGQMAAIAREIEGDAACQTREAKARKFMESAKARGIKGASRASYFRLRKRLEEEGILTAPGVPRIVLRRQRPPAPITQAEADALADPAANPAELAPPETPLDVPARAEFARPVTGGAAGTPAMPGTARPRLDDSLPGEATDTDDVDDPDNA